MPFAGPNTSKSIRTLSLALLLPCVAPYAQSRSTLEIITDPDSATVTLDDAPNPEVQKTPYINEKMLPGPHTVVLRSVNDAHNPIVKRFEIEPGQRTTLSEHFEYRTKAFGSEHLSVAPWKMEVGFGFEYLRYLGYQVAKATKLPTASVAQASSGAKAAQAASSYPDDSIPTSTSLPLQLRIGLPMGFETHFAFPFSSRTELDGTSEGLGLSDVSMGVKWTSQDINSAIDLTWNAGNATVAHLGNGARRLQISLITNQKYEKFDAFGQLSYRKNVSASTSPFAFGDDILLKTRGGYLLKNQFLPYLQIEGNYHLKKTYNTQDSGSPSYLVRFIPGFVWQTSRNSALELGIPLGLLASNGETHYGVNLSMSVGFGLPKGSASAPGFAGNRASAIAYGKGANSATTAPGFLLFESHEVSNAQYKNFCDKTSREYPSDPDFPSMRNYFTDPQYAEYPVVNVSLDDARSYARWRGARLPTVTEWTREFSSSSVPSTQVACGLEAPEPVSGRNQGAGLYSYIGNVAEWVESDRGATNSAYIAGGFFSLPPERCLDKSRWIDVSSPSGSKYIGFRLVTEVK